MGIINGTLCEYISDYMYMTILHCISKYLPFSFSKESEAQSSQELQELRLKNAALEKELARVKEAYEEELEGILKQVFV